MPVRRKSSEAGPPDRELRSNKRLHGNDEDHVPEMESTTPSKRCRRSAPEVLEKDSVAGDEVMATAVGAASGEAVKAEASPPQLPKAATPRRRARPANVSTPNSEASGTPKVRFDPGATPTRQALDRSARRKSARALIEGVMRDEADDDDDDADAHLARKIYDDSDTRAESEPDEDDEAEATHGKAAVDGVSATPSKAPRRRRAKSPTPPRELPPHELYFLHNKPGRPKTSDNTLGTLALLTHEEYFSLRRQHEQRLQADVDYLEALHAESFPQWTFELLQGFSLCLYGYGSKRALVRRFIQHVDAQAGAGAGATTVVVNGYAAAASMRDILACVAAAVDGQQRVPAGAPVAMVHGIAALLAAAPDRRLTLVVNSIDAPPLRKPGAQAALAQLAALPQVRLVCSADTPDFPLLWDVGLRSAFNFVFHDCTTFAPLTAELDVVDDVHELLGRRARRAHGRDGVAYVLRSLPENAKNLFRLLVGEVLVAIDADDDGGGHTDGAAAGVEYRMLYNKAVEEFICTSEMAFRTLLKEFHDHQIITSRKDAIGTELLSLPFSKDELEAILEDLMD